MYIYVNMNIDELLYIINHTKKKFSTNEIHENKMFLYACYKTGCHNSEIFSFKCLPAVSYVRL